VWGKKKGKGGSEGEKGKNREVKAQFTFIIK